MAPSTTHSVSPAVLLTTLALVACGGGGPAPMPSVVQLRLNETELNSSTASLALTTNGRTRYFTVENVGDRPALGLQLTVLKDLPNDATVTTTCASLLPGGRCTVDVTPGVTPSAAPADPDPGAALLRLQGSNTGPLDLAVQVLGFGSVYQGGLVFAIDDGTAAGGSVGGKVLRMPAGTRLDSDCDTIAPGASCTLTITPGAEPSAVPGDRNAQPVAVTLAGSNTAPLALSVEVLAFGSLYQGGYVFAIDDTTVDTSGIGGKAAAPNLLGPAPSGYSNDADTGARDAFDGQDNRQKLLAWYGQPAAGDPPYAAWVCASADLSGRQDWYLPAACELGYDGEDFYQDCGTADQLAMPDNVQTRLVDKGIVSPWALSDPVEGEVRLATSTHMGSDQSSHGQHDVRMQYHQRANPSQMPLYHIVGAQDYEAPLLCVRRLTP